jgi:hypothetical protein
MVKEKLILQLFLTDAQYLLLIVVVIVIIYCNSIGGAFIWDDRAAIVRNLVESAGILLFFLFLLS